MTRLQSYVEKYGTVAGPKLYHAIQSRSALIGANTRRRRSIANLTGRPVAIHRESPSVERPTPLLPDDGVAVAGG